MPDNHLSQLLDRAAATYSPDTSEALAKVKARSNRHRHTGMLSILVLLVGVVAVSLALVLTISDQQTANAVRYLRISPAVRIVDLPAASAKGPGGLSDVYFAKSNRGIGLDQQCELSPTTNTVCSLAIVRTDNAGRTWKPVGETLHVTYPESRGSYPFIDFATNGKDGWIYGSETFVTHDGGRSFEKNGPGGLVMDLSIVGKETWALSRPCPPGTPGCSSTVFTTPTGGGPWHALHGAPKLQYPYLQLVRTSPDDAFLAAQATDGTLYTTTDGGTSWASYPLPSLCDQLQHLTALSEDEVWVVCAGPAPSHSQPKEMFHSVNDGKSWVLVATSTPSPAPDIGVLPASGIVTMVTFVTPDRLLIAFNEGSPIASTDEGRTWKPQGLPSSGGVKQLSFTDSRHGWAVLYPNDTLYRTTDGGVHWTGAGS
jgi:photosystem II stability/assembly factor-like uncharacterized protein